MSVRQTDRDPLNTKLKPNREPSHSTELTEPLLYRC